MYHKKSSLVINDVFEELNEENKRLLNELSFADKLNRHLTEFKTFVDLNSTKFKLILNSSEVQKYDNLNENISQVLAEYQTNVENDCDVNRKSNENNVIKSEEPNHWSEIMSTDEYQANSVPTVETKDSGQEKRFECDICHKKFTYKKSLTRHQIKHSIVSLKPKIYVCKQSNCEYKCTSIEEIRDHRKGHQILNPSKRSVIPKTVIRDKTYVCQYLNCGFKSTSIEYFREHRNEHQMKTTEECPECGKTFPNRRRYRDHWKRVHRLSDQLLVCGIDGCNKEFRSSYKLGNHQSSAHLKKYQFACDHPGCDYRSSSRSNIEKHKRSRHSTERPFSCPTNGCHKAFTDKPRLTRHIETVHLKTGRIYPCEWPGCEYSSQYKSAVREHRTIVHTKERTFQCDVDGCGKWFPTQRQCRDHRNRVHRLGQQLSCHWPGCPFKTYIAPALSRHESNHITGGDHPCVWPECDKKYATKQSLEEHINTIHKNVKPYVCSVFGCSYRTAVSSNISKHMKKHKN